MAKKSFWGSLWKNIKDPFTPKKTTTLRSPGRKTTQGLKYNKTVGQLGDKKIISAVAQGAKGDLNKKLTAITPKTTTTMRRPAGRTSFALGKSYTTTPSYDVMGEARKSLAQQRENIEKTIKADTKGLTDPQKKVYKTFNTTGKVVSDLAVSSALGGPYIKAGSAVKSAAAGAAANAPLNLLLAKQDAKDGKDVAKRFVTNTAFDAVLGGALSAAPAIVRSLRKETAKNTAKNTAKKTAANTVKINYTRPEKKLAGKGFVQPMTEKEYQAFVDSIPKNTAKNVSPKETANPVSVAALNPVTKKVGTVPQMSKAQYQKFITSATNPSVGRVKLKSATIPKNLYTQEDTLFDQTKTILNEDIRSGGLDWHTKKQKDTIANAYKTVKTDAGQARKTFDKATETTDDVIAQGYALVDYYHSVKDYANAAKVAEDTAWRLSEAGRAVAAGRMALRTTPAGRLSLLSRTKTSLEKEFAGRLNGKGITISPEAQKRVADATTETEFNNAAQEAALEIWEQIPASWYEKLNTFRYMAMLGNPKTHIRNFIGNVLFAPLRVSKNVIATGLEAAAYKSGKITERTQAIFPSKEGLELGHKTFDENKNFIMQHSQRYLESLERPNDATVFKTAALEKSRKAIFGALEWEDAKILKPAYSGAFGRYLKANNISAANITPEQTERAMAVALEEGLRATFRDASRISSALTRLQKITPEKTMGGNIGAAMIGGVIPFTRTPVNLMRRGVDYSPLGLVKGFARIMGKDQKTVIKGIDNIASGLTGTGIMALGFWAYNAGILEGRLPYDAKGNFQRLQGEQGYAIKFGDKSYTIDWAVPFAFPLLTGVEFAKHAKDEGFSPDAALDALTQILTPATELSMMSGVSDVLNSVGQMDAAGVIVNSLMTAGTGYAGQFVPTALGQVARTIDDTKRSTTSTAKSSFNRQIEKFANKQIAKIPFASKTLEPAIDEWGRKTQTPTTERILENFLSPGFLSKKNVTSADKEISRLYNVLDEDTRNDVLPKTTTQYTLKFNGKDVRMTPEQLTMLKKTKGSTRLKLLKTLIETDKYKAMSDEDKAKAVKMVYDDASEIAKAKTLVYAGKDEWKVWTDSMSGNKADYDIVKKSGVKPEEYYNVFKDADLDGSGQPSQYEAYKKLESTNLSKEQKAILWNKFNKTWKNNPYAGGDIPLKGSSSGSSGSSGRSSGGSGGSSKSSGKSSTLATKQVQRLKTLNLTAKNEFTDAELRAIIKMLQA